MDAIAPVVGVVADVVEDQVDKKADADAHAAKEEHETNALEAKTHSICHNSDAVLRQGGSLSSREDSLVNLRTTKHFDGLDVEATPQLVEAIGLVEAKDYPKAMRLLRKNLEVPGTVNWCRIQFYCSYSTFFHCSNLYFCNKELAEKEEKKCCGKPDEYKELAEEMRELIKISLKDCHEVATTVLDAEKSVKGEELDLICQMCFSIMSLGNAYGLSEDKFLELALGLAGVWASKRNTVLAHTEKAMLESKRLEDPLQRITENMEAMSKDISKLNNSVKNQAGGGAGGAGDAAKLALNIASAFM